jgi:hypothetical protein
VEVVEQCGRPLSLDFCYQLAFNSSGVLAESSADLGKFIDPVSPALNRSFGQYRIRHADSLSKSLRVLYGIDAPSRTVGIAFDYNVSGAAKDSARRAYWAAGPRRSCCLYDAAESVPLQDSLCLWFD